MTVKKNEFLETMKKQYDELNYRWSREQDKFEADFQHADADVKKKYEEKKKEFQTVKKEMEKKIAYLETAGDHAWEDLKGGMENSWKAMTNAFDKAASHFKK